MQKKPKHPYYSTVVAILAAAAATPTLIAAGAEEGGQAHAGYIGQPRQTADTQVDGGGYYAPTSGGYSGLAQREMIRRQNNVAESDRLRDEARQAYAEGNYKEATDKYKQALQLLPNAPLLNDRRDFLKKSLADSSVELSKEYRRTGKYEKARHMLEDVVAEDPGAFAAKAELEYLDDPYRTNPALTEEHSKNIDRVRQGLYKAQGYYDLGLFDKAHDEYENVLRVDRYNSAARRGMERTAAARSSYYRAAYDHTRAELLSQVDQAWELAVPVDAPTGEIGFGNQPQGKAGSTLILQKLRNIIIPVVDFEDTSVEEAIDYLRVRSIELDTMSTRPEDKGINFVIRKPRNEGGGEGGLDAGDAGGGTPGNQRIPELHLRNVPLSQVLDYICDQTRLRWSVDEFAVTIKPAAEIGEDLFTRTFNVPPDFLSRISSGDDGGGVGGDVDPFAQPGAGGSSTALKPKGNVMEALKALGVKFGDGASAQLFASTSQLIVTNTPTNLDLVEQIVEGVQGQAPKQVKISTKFVEVSQENTDELGFDWILSPIGVGSKFLPGGGTIGSGMGRTNADFINPVDGVSIPGIPAAENVNVSNIVTGGNRTGDGAINRDSIQALLNNPNRSAQAAHAAPGILSLTGLFSDGQVQMIMRGLAQKKGTDLMTAPSVTARPGEKATIEIIREFIYPTEYEPPEIPTSVGQQGGGFGGGVGIGGGVQSYPVTPATPTSFETRNTGVTLEISPSIGNNDFVIDLNFAPEIVEFEGFINYGSPIQSPSSDLLGNPTTVTLTENRIEMPVFSKRGVNTALTMFDGYTVAVGGLMREDVQNVEDRVPILGDIPIIGRLFQTKAENRIKSNLIIFVTAEIIDATGRPLNRSAGTAAPDLGGGVGGVGVLPPLND